MESRKTVLMNLSAGQQLRHRHREHTYRQGRGEEGEGDTEAEHGKMYTNIYRRDSSGNFLCDSGNSKQGSITM